MKEYHKINSVFKRDENGKFILDLYSTPEFEYLKNNQWIATEKIDGTNIRIGMEDDELKIQGRTDNAQLPTILYEKLYSMFNKDKMVNCFTDDTGAIPTNVVLYGEGYGEKIQSGGRYIKNNVDFILFDVSIGNWFLKREDVEQIATSLNIKVVPIVGKYTLSEAVQIISNLEPIKSLVSEDTTLNMEGLVLTPEVPLHRRNCSRIITKLKYSDFRNI